MKEFFGGIWLKFIFLSIAVAIIIGVAVVGSNSINNIEEEKCWQTLEESAASISREIKLRVSDNQNVLLLAGKAIERGNMLEDRAALASYISTIKDATIFERVEVIYSDHTILFSDGTSRVISKDFLFTELSLLGEHLSARLTDLYNEDRQVVNYFVPIKDGKETIAILVGVIPCDILEDFFSTQIYNGKTHICIVDTTDGNFLMDDWHDTLGDVSVLQRHSPMKDYVNVDIMEEVMTMQEGSVAYVSDINGKNSYMHYMPVGIDNWELLVVVQEEVAFASFLSIRNMLTGITFIVLSVLISYYCHAILTNTRLLKNKKDVEQRLIVSDTLLECVRVLSLSENSEVAVNRLLKNIREFFDADRAYIFEIDFEREVINNSYEDYKEGISPEINIMQNIPLALVESWIDEFVKTGLFIIFNLEEDVDKDLPLYEALAKQNIHSMVAIPLRENDKIIGFLGADNPRKHTQNLSLISSITYFLMDSIKKRETQTLLERLSFEDALTGLHNRNKFSRVMDEFEAGTRTAKSLGFAYFDLNGLKVVNDESGHKAGDLLIQNTAKCLEVAFGTDAYRIGGDEFTVILPDVSEEAFVQMTNSVKALLEEQGISISLGISWKGKDYNIATQLYEADKAMYSDKRAHYVKFDRRREAVRYEE